MTVLVVVLAALALAAVLAPIAARRPEGVHDGAAIVLAYPAAWRMGVSAAFLAPVLVALTAVLPGAFPSEVQAPLLALAALQLVSLALLRLEVAGVRNRLTDEALIARSPWARREIAIRWGEIRRVRWSALGQVLVVEAGDGRSVRLSPLLSGLGELAERLTGREIPADALAPGVAERLARWIVALDARRGASA